MGDVAAVILAAGASTRMGSQKLLLPLENRPLVLHSIDEARNAGLHPIVVVTGSDADEVESVLPDDVVVARNAGWAQGPGSSIAAGVRVLNPEVAGVVILLADQVRVTARDLRALAGARAPIAAAAFGESFGAPAFFARSFFADLLTLDPRTGARPLLARHRDVMVLVPMEHAATDVDTAADYASVLRSQES